MRTRLSRSGPCLSLLATLWMSGAAPARAEEQLANEAWLALSPISHSYVALDEGPLVKTLCLTAGPEPGPTGTTAKCRVIAKSGTPPTESASSQSAPFETPCGTWDLTLQSNSVVIQPGSRMAVSEVPGDPERGVFAGVFDLNVTAHFTHRKKGTTADIPLRFGFSLADTWVLADRRGLPTPDNLILLADIEKDRFLAHERCVWPVGAPKGCPICLVPDPLRLSTVPLEF